MKLIIGIGNPGLKYQNTRHNIGFFVIDKVLRNLSQVLKKNSDFNAMIVSGMYNNEKYILAQPHTFVNLSGEAVARIMKYYDIDIKDILVIVDDINLATGKIRIREEGSSGGHNGLKSIINSLGTQNFKRIRIGIGNNEDIELDKYVLGKITSSEEKMITPAVDMCAEAVIMFIAGSYFKDIMTKYNTSNDN